MGAISVYGQTVDDLQCTEIRNAIVNDRIKHNFNMYTGTIGMTNEIKKICVRDYGRSIYGNDLINEYKKLIENNKNVASTQIFDKFTEIIFEKYVGRLKKNELTIFIDDSKPVGYRIVEPKLIRKEIGFNCISPYTLEKVNRILSDPNTTLSDGKGRINKSEVLQKGKGYIALESSIYTDYGSIGSCLYKERHDVGCWTSWGIRVFSTLEELENCEKFVEKVKKFESVYYIFKLSGDKLYAVTAKTKRKMCSTLTKEEIEKYKSNNCSINKLYNTVYFGMLSE